MMAANYLLIALGILGGMDILLYHSISHGIRDHSESRFELITHALRGPTYAILFLLTPNFELHGVWAFGYLTLLVFDVGISIADFWLERSSRAALGGLPSGEYVLHMIMAMLFGAFEACAAPTLFGLGSMQTEFVWSDQLAPVWMRTILATFAVGVLISGGMDALAALRLSGGSRKLVIENL